MRSARGGRWHARSANKSSRCGASRTARLAAVRRRLLAPRGCRCRWDTRRRQHRLPLPRPRFRRRRALHPHAVAGQASTRLPACGRIRSLERHRLIWVWPGDPARADPALVPDLHWNDDPAWEGDGDTLFARLRLPADHRQPDGPHARDLRACDQHRPPRHRRNARRRPRTTSAPSRSTRWMPDIDAPPFWRTQLGQPGNVDRWQIIRFEAPCTIVLDVGVAPGRHRRARRAIAPRA